MLTPSLNSLLFKFKDVFKELWFRCCMYCLMALLAFALGPLLSPFIPDGIKTIVSRDALSNILQVIASSMLAVTTFSLSIMVQALSSATTTATPRASKLLTEDRTAQHALGAFIGAFLFSITGIIGLKANLYREDVIVVLFLFTLVMIAIIIIMLLRWIGQLSKLGRVGESISLVENALEESIDERKESPTLYARLLPEDFCDKKSSCHPVPAPSIGYLRYLDLQKLNSTAEELEMELYIQRCPGAFIRRDKPLMFSTKPLTDDQMQTLMKAVVIGDERSFSQDPRYGFIILCEIALRAMSPGVNDPGTAIAVLTSYVRSLERWLNNTASSGKSSDDADKIKYQRLYIPKIATDDIVQDMFAPLLPFIGEHFNVLMQVNKSLVAMAHMQQGMHFNELKKWQDRLFIVAKRDLIDFEYQDFTKMAEKL